MSNKKIFLVVVLIIIVAVFMVAFFFNNPIKKSKAPKPLAQTAEKSDNRPKTLQQTKPNQPAGRASSVTHPITQAVVKLGVLSAAKRINQVASYIIGNNKYGASIFFPKFQSDESLISLSLEICDENSISAYASASFSPYPGKNTSAVYDIVQYSENTPRAIRESVYKNVKTEKVLEKNIIMLDAGAVKIFLMPAGKGCIIIKKEVVR